MDPQDLFLVNCDQLAQTIVCKYSALKQVPGDTGQCNSALRMQEEADLDTLQGISLAHRTCSRTLLTLAYWYAHALIHTTHLLKC